MRSEEEQAELNEQLLNAAEEGDVNKVQELLTAGAEVNTVDEDGLAALHLAADNGHTAIVESLLKAGGKVNAADEDGQTPLHLAVLNGHTDTAISLIEAKADVNALDENQETALDIAQNKKHNDIYNQLINALAIRINKDAEDTVLPFAMGTHSRLGKESSMRQIDPDVMMIILDKLSSGMADDIAGEHRDAVQKKLNELHKRRRTLPGFADKVVEEERAAAGRRGR